MKSQIKTLLISILLSSGVAMSAEAKENNGELILSFFGAAHDNKIQGDSDPNFGLGAFVETNMNSHIGIETGFVYINRQYKSKAAGFEVVQETGRLHIPVMVKFWLNDYLAVAAGPYASVKVGNTSTEFSFGDADLGAIETSADDDVEFGYDISGTLNFAIREKTGLFVEGRYSDLFSSESDEETDQIFLLAGVKITL